MILEFVSQALQTQPVLYVTTTALFGLLIGSFLNVVIYRLPKMLEQQWRTDCEFLNGQAAATSERFNLVVPRSACPTCGHVISALENIPVLSFIFLRGRCRACHARISIRYPLIELASAGLSALVALQFGYTSLACYALLFVWVMLVLTMIDIDTRLLPDVLTLPLLWLGLLCNLSHGFTDLRAAVIGAMAGYLLLWGIYWLFKLITGKEGMGYGDFKLLAAIGAWFGWQSLTAVILLSSVIGSVLGIALIIFKGKSHQAAIPFGPFLALGGVATLFGGSQLLMLLGLQPL